ncbi:MAG: hypothetical protein QXK88_09690 [Desulfurococcaceae archaeon]
MPQFPLNVIMHNVILVLALTIIYFTIGTKFIKWKEFMIKEWGK